MTTTTLENPALNTDSVDPVKAICGVTAKTIRARRKKWLEALRSGEYKQGRNRLKKKARGEIRHCCLGVASEICGVKNVIDLDYPVKPGVYQFRFGSGLGTEILPTEAALWLGLATRNPTIDLADDSEGVATLNDRGWSFKKIADAIEKHGFRDQDDLLTERGRYKYDLYGMC